MCTSFRWAYVFISLGYVLRSEIARSYDKFAFNILRNCLTVFLSGCSILWFRQQCTRVSIPHIPVSLFDCSCFSGVSGISLWFRFSFPKRVHIEHFSCNFTLFYILLREMYIQVFACFVVGCVCLLIQLQGSLYVLSTSSFL